MITAMKIGLLPLYVKLYDDKLPEMRERTEKFYSDIAGRFEQCGMEVIRAPFCRLKEEFCKAVGDFEKGGAKAIVTLHIAYSPSLESVEALCGTKLPVVVLDTTQTLEFTNRQNPDEIMYCHGIHGVMDMCSMLTRRGKEYAIAAGHFSESDCIERVCGYVRAAAAASSLKNAKVGLIGGVFEGMGDFQVPYSELNERFGIEVEPQSPEYIRALSDGITAAQIEAEIERSRELYEFSDGIIREEYVESVRSCLALRKIIKERKLSAFSVNFSGIGRENSGLSTMPFAECCLAMSRGTGYAGEGDVLTAAFVGALLHGWAETTFVEIFCPDWKNNMVFLSHMGEVNYRIADTKPKITRVGVNYSPGGFPYVGYTRMKGGAGVYVNVSRGRKGYKLLAASAEMIGYDDDNFDGSMRGWMQTEKSCAEFLEALSENGATHHSAFVYGANTDELRYFGRLLGLETVVI